jgi:hypothetical protein
MNMNFPVVHVGDAVRFWTPETGMREQRGTICTVRISQGILEAEIIPDRGPERRVFLCYGAVWGFKPVEVTT